MQRRALFFLYILLAISGLSTTPPACGADLPEVTMPKIAIQPFGDAIPPVGEMSFKAQLADTATTIEKAINTREVLKFLKVELSTAQKEFINKHKFLLLPKAQTAYKGRFVLSGTMNDWDEMLGLFDEVSGNWAPALRSPENTHLVTPGIVLHGFHKYLENLMQYLESTDLPLSLKAFLVTSRDLALANKLRAKGILSQRFELIAAQLTVPLVILENAHWERKEVDSSSGKGGAPQFAPDKDDTLKNALEKVKPLSKEFSPAVFKKVQEELRLVYRSQDVTVSPLYGEYSADGSLKCDYTQFTPRSHYTKSSLLRAYFRAMIYLGRQTYRFETDNGITDAVLLAYILSSPDGKKPPSVVEWKKLAEVTSFFAGPSDDIGFPVWRDFLEKVLGTGSLDVTKAADPQFVKRLSSRLSELSAPRVLSDVVVSPDVLGKTKEELLDASKGFRILGQRFTFSSWILNRLTAGEEKTSLRLPSMPSALFVPAAFGDMTALKMARTFLTTLPKPFSEDECRAFETRLDEVRKDLTKVTPDEWYGSIGAAWLNVLRTLTQSYGDGYPLYMQSSLFPLLQLEAYLGSFTELKHDTLLYDKPSYAECGEGGPDEIPPVPKGFVEPNIPFWKNMKNLVDYTKAGLKKYNLVSSEAEQYSRIGEFSRQIDLFTRFAEMELKGQEIASQAYEDLRTTHLSAIARPFFENLVYDDDDRKSALIADIHTDAADSRILYEATGQPSILLVLVGNENTARLAIGVAFNHFEFTAPLGKRRSDDDWKADAYAEPPKVPEKNFWYKDLIVK